MFFCFFGAKIWPAAADTGELGWDLRDPTPLSIKVLSGLQASTCTYGPYWPQALGHWHWHILSFKFARVRASAEGPLPKPDSEPDSEIQRRWQAPRTIKSGNRVSEFGSHLEDVGHGHVRRTEADLTPWLRVQVE